MNDCAASKETGRLAHLMVFFLSVGYMHIGYGVAYTLLLPKAIMKYMILLRLEKR